MSVKRSRASKIVDSFVSIAGLVVGLMLLIPTYPYLEIPEPYSSVVFVVVMSVLVIYTIAVNIVIWRDNDSIDTTDFGSGFEEIV